MGWQAKISDVGFDYQTNDLKVTFNFNRDKSDVINHINDLDKDAVLSVDFKKYRKSRSRDANAMLWACIGDMATALGDDKWNVYMRLLRRYGKFTYITVIADAVEKMKLIWRESEEIARHVEDGIEHVDMLCYFGSSTYDTKEFSVLLEGTISEMRDMGLKVPATKDIERGLELWDSGKKKG